MRYAHGLDFAGLLQQPVDVTQLRQTLDDYMKRVGVLSIDEPDLALSSNQIPVAYQAKIDLGTGQVTGAEALDKKTSMLKSGVQVATYDKSGW